MPKYPAQGLEHSGEVLNSLKVYNYACPIGLL